MSVKYRLVQWTPRKLVYDAALLVGVAVYYVLFMRVSASAGGGRLDPRILEMRAWGTCSLLMLTLILAIGPAARLERRLLPLLYNRRHFGVLFFVVAAMHARAVLGYYYDYTGDLSKLVAFLSSDNRFTSASVPFPLFGGAALGYFFVMAATSHDFWQRMLGPVTWKWLHMGVYGAYALVVAHVALGAMKSEAHPVFVVLLLGSVAFVAALHMLAARRANATVEPRWVALDGSRWVDAGTPEAIPDGRAVPICVPGHETIALVRYDGQLSALHGVCAHQGGPLHEGRVLFGSLTCPWHGWQYRPADGRSPPPFTEQLPTYRVRLHEGRVLVLPVALPPGTATEPAVFDVAAADLARKRTEQADA